MTLDPTAFLDRTQLLPDVPDGEPFLPWKLRVLSPDELAALSPSRDRVAPAQLAYIASFAVLAPTTHNTVPQRFRLRAEERKLQIWLDRSRVLPASDPVGRQATVSLGCVIANAVCAARAYGWDAAVQVHPVPAERTRPLVPAEPRYTLLAEILFQPWASEPGGEAWLRAMLRRKVVRAEFDLRIKLDPELAARLGEHVAAYPGLCLHLLTDAPTLLFLGKFQELADSTVFNRDDFAIELGEWMLENDSESSVGMRGREFGLSDEMALRMRRGFLRTGPLLPDEIAGMAKGSNIGMRSSSAVAVITAERDDLEQRLAAGRAYEELALLLLQHDFCTAMHAGITEVEAPNMALRGRLRTMSRPTVVFRLGRPLREEDGQRPRSSRPGLAELLLPDEAL